MSSLTFYALPKKQGLIVDYKAYSNFTKESAGDWDYAVALVFKSFAAFEEIGPKTGAITLKHYGTAEKRTEAQEMRNQLMEQVSRRVMREMRLTPLP